MSKFLTILKYILFGIVSLLLILIWQGVFILQGGIGYEGNLILLPFKLLPIILYTSLALWLILKMFDKNKIVVKRWYLCHAMGVFSLLLSLSFQNLSISKRAPPYTLTNEYFSHIQPVDFAQDFKYRTLLSSTGYARLLPLGKVDNDTTSYLSNVALEASLLFQLQELVNKKMLNNTCKK